MTSLGDLNPDFRDFLLLLADERAEFMIVGAYALAYHGAPRASGDIDVFARPTAENAARVYRALVAFGAPVLAAGLKQEDLATPGLVYQMGLPPRRIDVLTKISGVTFEEAWARRQEAELEGRTVAVIGRDDFVRNKQAAGRPKDLANVARLSKPAGMRGDHPPRLSRRCHVLTGRDTVASLRSWPRNG
jgi:hypothetical protein